MVYTAAQLSRSGLCEEESVVEMIGKYFFQMTSHGRRGSSSIRRGSVESCEETDNNLTISACDPGVAYEEQLLQQDVTRQMELCLTEAKSSLHIQMLLLPRHMTGRVARDVLCSSADEPCGLRGAAITLYIQQGKDGTLLHAGSFCPDPSVTPTFELSVIFKAENDGGWPPLKHIFDSNKVLKLRPEYRLVKRKLYSSASPVIHDFN